MQIAGSSRLAKSDTLGWDLVTYVFTLSRVFHLEQVKALK